MKRLLCSFLLTAALLPSFFLSSTGLAQTVEHTAVTPVPGAGGYEGLLISGDGIALGAAKATVSRAGATTLVIRYFSRGNQSIGLTLTTATGALTPKHALPSNLTLDLTLQTPSTGAPSITGTIGEDSNSYSVTLASQLAPANVSDLAGTFTSQFTSSASQFASTDGLVEVFSIKVGPSGSVHAVAKGAEGTSMSGGRVDADGTWRVFVKNTHLVAGAELTFSDATTASGTGSVHTFPVIFHHQTVKDSFEASGDFNAARFTGADAFGSGNLTFTASTPNETAAAESATVTPSSTNDAVARSINPKVTLTVSRQTGFITGLYTVKIGNQKPAFTTLGVFIQGTGGVGFVKKNGQLLGDFELQSAP